MFSMIRGGLDSPIYLKNPIGQTGVPISILIYADLNYFNISINGGDYIDYPLQAPPWTVNYVMIQGAISDVKFYGYDQNLSTCPTLIKKFPIFKLPKNILKLENELIENEEIIIIGKIIKPFKRIKINFLHGALQVHTIFGQTVFQLKITKDCSSVNSFYDEEWILNPSCNKHKNLKANQNIKINIKIKSIYDYIYLIETNEDLYKGKGKIPIPFTATEYIQVRRQDNGFILLTDKVNTQHKLHYVNMDQCMLQPEQEEIGSYGLIFEKQNGYLCDEILICYPSQLVRNSSNGMTPVILYRLPKIVKKRSIFVGNDSIIYNEYFSKIEKGAPLHKFAGCGCSINIWYKKPTIPSNILIPNNSINLLNKKDKDCPIRYTNTTIIKLGNILNKEEKIINFTLLIGYTKQILINITLFNEEITFYSIRFNENIIHFLTLLYIIYLIFLNILSNYLMYLIIQLICLIQSNLRKFLLIKFLYGVQEENKYIGVTFFGLEVNLNKNKVIAYSKKFNDTRSEISSTESNLFKKGKPFECEIKVLPGHFKSSDLKLFINKEYQSNYSFDIFIPPRMINRISMGVMELFYVLRQKFQLQKKYPMEEVLKYFYYMMQAIGDVVLYLKFIFNFNDSITVKNMKYKRGKNSLLLLNSRKDNKWEIDEVYDNPVQTGMDIIILIYAENDYYNISINGGDYIHYEHKMPSWTVTNIMVRFNFTFSSRS
ncbi:Galectin [Meloidogyne graminicola]|uniref:Galectin n=1 Tax=Meloidogyne graminicola TaxID=189291 RepID=A0A8T0A2B1_9BILA|nr:Galectin [Meloidogyne graminicola]